MTPNPTASDEFYIGYEDGVPPRIGARVQQACLALGVVSVLALVIALFAHRTLEPSRFEFGRPRPVSGGLSHAPYPSLRTERGRVWLVGRGKHGADMDVAAVPDGPAMVEGTTIQRGAHAMLELLPGSARTASASASPSTARADAGVDGELDVTLTGEIVDGKCFLGVMNPGERTVHRDCARLCLQGGIPPMLLVRGGMGEEALVLLVSPDGQELGPTLASLAGVPVRVRGRLRREGGELSMATERAWVETLKAP